MNHHLQNMQPVFRLFLILFICISAHPVHGQEFSRKRAGYPVFSREEYRSRAQRLMDQVGDGIAILRGAPEPEGDFQFYQYNNLSYFTGLDIPGITVAMNGFNHTVILFMTFSDEEARAEGIPVEVVRDPQRFTGIDSVYPISYFGTWLEAAVRSGKVLYTPFRAEELRAEVSTEKTGILNKSMTQDEWDGRLTREMQFVEKLKKRFPDTTIKDCWGMVSDLRKIKSDEEIAVMREAGRIGVLAHRALIRETRVGAEEQHLANVFESTCKNEGGDGLAYNTIIMSAENIPYGHYHRYNRTLADGDFVVLDAGPELFHYDVDFSTSFPANGRFTPKQKELYDLANGIRMTCLAAYRPGITFRQAGQEVKKWLTDHGYDPGESRFRGLINYGGYNHSVGMAVHDGMGTFKGPDEVLKPGFVFACDINMMYPELNIGIRLEDTVVITETGCEILSAGMPRSTEELEQLMKQTHE